MAHVLSRVVGIRLMRAKQKQHRFGMPQLVACWSPIEVISLQYQQSHGRPMGNASLPVPGIRRCKSGTPTRGNVSSRITATLILYGVLPGRPTEHVLLPPVKMGRYRSGMLAREKPCSRIAAIPLPCILRPGHQTEHVLSRLLLMGLHKSGMLAQEKLSSLIRGMHSRPCGQLHGRPMAHVSLQLVLITRCKSGMEILAKLSSPTMVMREPSLPWSGRPMANASFRQARMVAYRSGKLSEFSFSYVVLTCKAQVSLLEKSCANKEGNELWQHMNIQPTRLLSHRRIGPLTLSQRPRSSISGLENGISPGLMEDTERIASRLFSMAR